MCLMGGVSMLMRLPKAENYPLWGCECDTHLFNHPQMAVAG